MSPLVKPWLCSSLVVTPSGLASAFLFAKYDLTIVHPWVGIIISLIPVIGLSCVFGAIFCRGEIDRLYSEDYQMATKFMTHTQEKGETAEGMEALHAFMDKRGKREISGNKR